MASKDPRKEDEPAFRVTDRRRVGREESPEVADAAEPPPRTQPERPPSATGEAPPTAETTAREETATEGPEVSPLGTPDLVRLFIAELQTRALIHLGLLPHPVSRLVATDLTEARLAINCLAALVGELGPLVAPAERDALQQMVTELRLHFVRQRGA